MRRVVDLSHRIRRGMDGMDLAALPLERTVELDGIVLAAM